MSIIALLLAGFAAGLAARGAFAQPNGTTIYACKGERSGSVRLVDGAGDCNRGEVLVTWNSVGPVGADGDDGVSGYSLATNNPAPVSFGPGTGASYGVTCPAGTVAISGGWAATPGFAILAVHSERNPSQENVWLFNFFNASASPSPTITLNLSASCVTLDS